MAGIVAYGAYIPKFRLSRDLIARAWGSGSMGGEKAVANFDEDTITMAVEAAFDCLGDTDPKKVDSLYFASTTSPYKEKQSASLMATVLDLRRDILTSDFSGSLRAGTNALKAGLDAIEGKSAGMALVTATECRLGAANSDFEQSLGDGAAAFLLGDADVAAEITGSYSVADEFTDYWRMEQDTFVKSWEDRFSNIYGYANSIQEAVIGILKKYNLAPKDFARLVLYAPNPRQHTDVARKLGFDAKTQLADLLFATVGNTGTALAAMMLVAALEQSNPGDRLLCVSYGEGADAFILEVTPHIKKLTGRRGIQGHLPSKTMLPSYEKYVQFRDLMVTEEARTFPSPSSIPLFWRDRKSFFAFYGSRCKRCSLIQHPVQRICYHCQSKDEYEEVKLARTGKIFTYSEDYLANVPVLPQISASIDLDDGARVFLRLTESEAQNPADPPRKIGMPVETTFRKLSDTSGFRNYYWKARPIRGGK
jgi:3-hydroxy-3-methylglutaryl CoA synthase